MTWVYSHYKYVCSYSAGIDFSRQNLTSTDVRFWRLKSIPALGVLRRFDNVIHIAIYMNEMSTSNSWRTLWFQIIRFSIRYGKRIGNLCNIFRIFYCRLYQILSLESLSYHGYSWIAYRELLKRSLCLIFQHSDMIISKSIFHNE